jgi:hypothetical protein
VSGSLGQGRGCGAPPISIFRSKTILEKHHVARYIKIERTVREDHIYKQARRSSALIWVRCMMRRALASNGARRCMV